MRLVLKNIFLIGALCFLSSCAFFLNNKNVDVAINSNPSGADIVIDGKNYGKTPATINLEPKNYTAILTKEGYGSAQLKLETWQALRRKDGEGGRCLADALGAMLIAPMFSYWSVYCRDFKESEYSVNIPYLGSASPSQFQYNAPPPQQQAPQTQFQGQYQNYYQPYNYNAPASSY